MSTDPKPRSRRSRKVKNTFTTKSGKTIKVNRSLGERIKAGRDAKARRKAAYLSSLPKERWRRLLYRLQPKRLAKYWFSRDGAIMALKIVGVGMVVVFLVLVGMFAYFRKDLPKIKDLSGSGFGGSVTYYAKDGTTVLWQDYNAVKRVPVSGDKMSKNMRDATVAIEDKDFYNHGAFDVRGITRAGLHDVFGSGGSVQGGSTITQQLVKLNEGWTQDRTITRKVKELILAVELEREYSKDDILTGYLNLAPYGGVDYGVETAARDYFGVDASNLTLAQSAMLASIPKSPYYLSPFSSTRFNPSATTSSFDKDGLIARQHYVLDQMADQNYITQMQADAAKKVDVLSQVKQLQSHFSGIKAPYFVLAAKEQLKRQFPAAIVERGGWKVITTLDVNLQNLAEKSVADAARQMSSQRADNAAFVAEDNATGQVVALVGGVDFSNPVYGQINYASDVNISPGSSIKPFTYTTFINNNNAGAGSIVYDTQGPLPGYPCTEKGNPTHDSNANCLWDDTRSYSGPQTLRYALGGSLNVPAVKLFLSAVPNDNSSGRTKSINKVISTTNALMASKDGYRCYKPGVDVTTASKADETQCYASAGIGDGAYLHLTDQVNGIASIARLGKAVPQTLILKVTDSSGHVLTKFTQPAGTQVVKPDSAYIVNDMAADPGASYLGGSCTETNCYSLKFHRYKGWHNAIKTGTTNDQYDGLMMSWNSKYSAGVWVGNHTRTVSYSGQPEYMTDPIMKQWMQGAIDQLGDVKPDNWTKPSGVKTDPAFVLTRVPFRGQTAPSPRTDLFPSWYQPKTNSATNQTIDKVSGKLATSCTPSLAKETATNRNANTWNVDVFAGARSSTLTETDDVHKCSDIKPQPTITVTDSDSGNNDVCELKCTVTVTATNGTYALTGGGYTTAPAGTAIISINGQVWQTVPMNDPSLSTLSFTYTPTTTGTMDFSVQVIDSALYDSTDATTVSVTAPGPATKPDTPEAPTPKS
ncbi:MAG: transglycosylase domain-containing protein [Candidatus Saccharimonadales bacterium]